MLAFLGSSMVFTSCKTDEDRRITETKTLDEQLSEDENFRVAVTALGTLAAVSADNDWAGRMDEISATITKVKQGNYQLEEIEAIERVLGISIAELQLNLESVVKNIAVLHDRYSELENMNSADRNALFSLAIQNSDEITSILHDLQIGDEQFRRACIWRDLCNGIVGLASLLGGPVLCEAISTAIGIPGVGTIVCTIVIALAEDLLGGICNGINC